MPPKNESSETEREPQEATKEELANAAFAELLSEGEEALAQERATGDELPQLSAEQLAKIIAAKPELAEAIADTEPIKRRVQSEADKRFDRFRRETEAQRAQEAAQAQQAEELQRVQEMDDEDYGRHMREQETKQQETQQRVNQTLEAEYRRVGGLLLDAIPDPDERQRVNEGKYTSWEEFTQAAIAAARDASVKQTQAKRQKVQSESATKEETAEEVESASAMITGAGAPSTSRLAFKRLPPDEQWRVALKELFAQK
jgi:hypothetical protein